MGGFRDQGHTNLDSFRGSLIQLHGGFCSSIRVCRRRVRIHHILQLVDVEIFFQDLQGW